MTIRVRQVSSATRSETPAPLMPTLVWRAQISGLLAELTSEVLALTDVVIKLAERLQALEQAAESDVGEAG